jgi:hypothetical protein
MVKSEKGEYRTIVPEYIPLKSSKKSRAVVKPKAKPQSAGIAALKVDTTPKAAPTKAITQWDADTIINNIGLKQARALYDELKKIFGG